MQTRAAGPASPRRPERVFTLGDRQLSPAWINDYVAVSHRTAPRVEVKDSDMVFAGYGIVAPEYDWDDFKGMDVRGKTIVVLVNNPPFKGKAMTYYGRWTYKYEEASALGAAACLIVHETGPAGYPFAVIAASQGTGKLRPDRRPTATPAMWRWKAGSP